MTTGTILQVNTIPNCNGEKFVDAQEVSSAVSSDSEDFFFYDASKDLIDWESLNLLEYIIVSSVVTLSRFAGAITGSAKGLYLGLFKPLPTNCLT
mmetsp:Transcript_23903/g.28926  ORF Transcript_23903/g.28926 Transcript_23903/m.28926 type:complete len:95 (-) Transcript_23903:1126-1410(-)